MIQVRNVDHDRQPTGMPYRALIHELSNGETFKAAAALGLVPKEYATVEARRSAIRQAMLKGAAWNPVNASTRGTDHADDNNEDAVSDSDAETPPKKAKAAATTDAGSLDAIVEAIARRAAESMTAQVDEDAVATLIDDKVREAVAKMAPRVIVVDRDERREVSGRTHRSFDKMMDVLTSPAPFNHPWLVGPPATGKSTLAAQAAEALGVPFYSVSCVDGLPLYLILGFKAPDGTYHPSDFRRAYTEGGVFLFDEVDNGDANTLGMLNSALANGHFAFPDGLQTRNENTYVVAAANTFGNGGSREYSGRNMLDAAFKDRFTTIEVDYDEDLEREMTYAALEDSKRADRWIKAVWTMRQNVTDHGLKVFVTTRGLVGGAHLLQKGWPVDDVVTSRVLPDVKPDQRDKVLAGVSLGSI